MAWLNYRIAGRWTKPSMSRSPERQLRPRHLPALRLRRLRHLGAHRPPCRRSADAFAQQARVITEHRQVGRGRPLLPATAPKVRSAASTAAFAASIFAAGR